MSISIILLVALLTIFGASIQSISGMGFGLAVVPFLVVIMGPNQGVLWGNLLGLVISTVVAITRWQDIEWRIFTKFTMAAFPAVLLTVLVLREIPLAIMEIGLGLLMLAMVAFSFLAPRLPIINGPLAIYGTGFLGAVFSAAVAQSGPVMTAYAQSSRWKQHHFSATCQPYFVVLNIFNIVSKLNLGLVPDFGHGAWWVAIVAVLGILIGNFLAIKGQRLVSPEKARLAAMIIGGVGAVIVTFRGVCTIGLF